MKTIKEKNLYFDEAVLKEKWEYVTTYAGLDIYDSCHMFERFKERFPEWDEIELIDVLQDGIDFIKKRFGLREANQYMIISNSIGVKIALEIRPDRHNPRKILGVVPTVLSKKEHPFNLRGEIEVFVERSLKENKYEIGWYEGTDFCEVIQEGKIHYKYERIFVF